MGVKAGCRRPESVRTVRGFTKRRNWEDLYIGDALSYFPLDIMLWSPMGCFVDAAVARSWKTVGGMSRAPLFEDCLWDLHRLGRKGYEHVFTTTGGIAYKRLQSACISAGPSVRALAKAHSPEVRSSIRSHRFHLEHGRIAQRSLPAYKRNVLCSVAALMAPTVLSTGFVELMARRHAPDSSDTSMKTSCIHPRHLKPLRRPKKPTVHFISRHILAHKT